ncbi:hypothetical protein OIDMADRAFT_148126 [Oidiodendron maius Zn]|uniref:Uncharacterized protein n=1 Tax=Oidiodendron maius (strain Zn) TaxID=913774 RepID=A0A0C3CDF3_OIDMZ|nr:hypothetical protein OIDMADRAFT_148126 [Oidiodendron maius Zn]
MRDIPSYPNHYHTSETSPSFSCRQLPAAIRSITTKALQPMTSGTSGPTQEDFDSKSIFSTSTISSTRSLLKGMFRNMIQVSNKKPGEPESRKCDAERELARKDNGPTQRPLYIKGANSTAVVAIIPVDECIMYQWSV